MRIFLLFAVVAAALAYVFRDELKVWGESFVADRVLHALNGDDSPQPATPGAPPAAPGYFQDFAKGVGKKVLAGYHPTIGGFKL